MPPKKGKQNGGGGAAAAHAAAAAVQAAAAAKAAAAAAGNGKKKGGGTVGSAKPADSDFIVFTNSSKEKKKPAGAAVAAAGTTSAGASASAAATAAAGPPEPPKPTAKQLIGGTSWTGKLPVNLLSEHCQKQKWDRPDYDVRKVKDGFSAFVSLSARNSKTGETTRLEPFKLPPSHVHLAVKPTALEARHFAATYGLFRVCSMKNLHMMLPPEHKNLWREFGVLKAADVKEGKAWLYEADPFTALRERELAKATAEKKRKEQQAARDKAASMPGAAGLAALRGMSIGGGGGNSGGHSGGNSGGNGGRGGNSGNSGGANFNPMRGWTNIPKIEMGGKTRTMLEDLLRRGSVWNQYGVEMPAAARARIVDEFSTRLGFRKSHVEEATVLCRDREETLEWLLVHVPEDDLPRWSLPESYTAGVSVASTDLRRESAIQRLAQSGYAADLCRKVYDASGGDEGKAAGALQTILAGSSATASDKDGETASAFLSTSYDTPEEGWEAELASLESVFSSEQYKRVSPDVCEIRLTDVVNGGLAVDASMQFRRAPTYPVDITVTIVAPQLPAYVKLSILRKTLAYVRESVPDEEMKIYFVIDWVQQNINDMIERPGALKDIAAAASAASEEVDAAEGDGAGRRFHKSAERRKRQRGPPREISWKRDERSRQEWLRRQETPALQKMVAQRRRLPAWEVRETVVDTVAANQVTIISGETGSGKSTQAVQFVLDDLYSNGLGLSANMMVTQPRRISALGLADRVSEERCTSLGDEVGYVIRGESKMTAGRTRITFCTTGVLLRRLQVSGGRIEDVVASLADVSHVVIDEVHERSLDTDFLLSILRDVLRARPDTLKLVLMSATLDASTFKDYFVRDGLTVGSVNIAGRTFPVDDMYLDDVIRATGFGLDGNPRTYQNTYGQQQRDSGGKDSDETDPVAKAIQRLGSRINYGLVADTARAIDEEMTLANESGGILIFMPGVGEINQVCNLLKSERGGDTRSSALHVLPLHAALETREQRRVFAAPPAGRRKIVVATNVAETSITIDDIVAVIDTGRVKETSYDAQTNMRKLEETWASKAACKQRRGRAGRVRAGKCYKLYTRNLEEQHMPERPEPEMRRVPLEQLCLSVRAMGIVDVAGFLGRAPTPPEVAAVDGALSLLRRMGILVQVDEADGTTSTDHLTALGKQVAVIPADLRCGKLMVFGALFGCLHECVTVAAILSGRSPFVVPPTPEKRELAKAARMRFTSASAGDGDLLTDLRAVLRWDELARDGGMYGKQAKYFCEDNFLNNQTLADIASTRAQLYQSLAEIGIRPDKDKDRTQVNHLLLRALTAAAFSPQIARIQLPDQKFAASVSGTVAIDPEARTIRYFSRDHGRVFVHPSSTMFDAQGFAGRAAFLSYFSLIATSKVFVRDLTPFNAYTLLMFSGDIQLDTLGRGLIVDGWLRLRGWARIGVLVSRLRGMVDRLIARRLGHEADDEAGSAEDAAAAEQLDQDVIKAVIKLIELDGMDN